MGRILWTRKLIALIKKNILLKKRSPIGTACEILLPLILFTITGVGFFFLSKLDITIPFPQQDVPDFYSTTTYTMCLSQTRDPTKCYLGIYPDPQKSSMPYYSNLTKLLATEILGPSGSEIPLMFKYFDSQDEMLDWYYKNPSQLWGGIVFTENDQYLSEPLLEYTIRLNNSFVPVKIEYAGFSDFVGYGSYYATNGFLTLQSAVDTAFIKLLQQTSPNSELLTKGNIKHQYEPFPLQLGGLVGSLVQILLVSFFVYSFIPQLLMSIISLVQEKKEKVKETLKMMGMSESLYWTSWMITFLGSILFISISATIIGRFLIFKNSNPFLIWIIFFLFSTSIISFSFLVSVFIETTMVAVIVTILWLYILISAVSFLQRASSVTKGFAFLASPLSFSLAMMEFLGLEFHDSGVNFDNASSDLQLAIAMLFVDTIIYAFLAWYFANVVPGEYGVAKPFYFMFQKSYWFGSQINNENDEKSLLLNDRSSESLQDPSFFESIENNDMKRGVVIKELKKVWGNPTDKNAPSTVAVNNLNIEMLENQIFALLGVNGAGKSTTISMLTGLYPPTSGDAYIEGYSILHDRESISQLVGVCPQDNILFGDLTGKEHLLLFGALKGGDLSSLPSEANQLLNMIGLADKADIITKNYSGGMKRKLCVAIALVGGSKVIFLDEPTSGMDTLARREFWNVLKKISKGRTIILTTHYMEEADVLGDRIGIMNDGVLQCCGSSIFLKNKFGAGYYLNIVGKDNFSSEENLQFVTRSIPDAQIVEEGGNDISVLLPIDSMKDFPDLFGSLESNKNKLNIESFGVSMTTLEDVFLRIIRGKGVKEQPSGYSTSVQTDTSINVSEISQDKSENYAFTPAAFKQQFNALLYKKMIMIKRNYKTTILTMLLPSILFLLTVASLKLNGITVIDNNLDSPTSFDISSYYPVLLPYGSSRLYDDGLILDVIDKLSNGNIKMKKFNDEDKLYDYVLNDRSSDWFNHRFGAVNFTMLNYNQNSYVLTVLTNNSVIDSIPTFVNLYDNSFLNLMINSSSNPKQSIKVSGQPFPGASFAMPQGGSNTPSLIIGLIIGYSIVLSILCRDIVYEKQYKIKWQYSLMSCNSIIYWTSNFICDYLLLLPSMFIIIILALIFDVKEFIGIFSAGFFAVFLFGFISMLSLNYGFSTIFQKAETCLKFGVFLNVITAAAPFLVNIIFRTTSTSTGSSSNDGSNPLDTFLRYVPLVFPTSAYSEGLSRLGDMQSYFESLPPEKRPSVSYLFEWDQLSSVIFFLLLEFIVLIAYVFYVDYMANKKVPRTQWNMNHVEQQPGEEPDDIDVQKEKERLSNWDAVDDLVKTRDLKKQFGKFEAVKGVTFGIKPNECLGLLGPNGAGKTTTISMLTREERPTGGDVSLVKTSIWDTDRQSHYSIARPGCCLQFDSLSDYLTGREHLELYLKLRRRLSDDQIRSIVNEAITRMNLDAHADKITKNYSGGTKRKLSVALSMLSGNRVIFLDEPSTGMDPNTRRSLWRAIEIEKSKEGRSILLTTHSLEEAEATCNRIGIMVAGKMRCLGTKQHLKNRYGNRYFVHINCNESKIQEVDQFIFQTFKGSSLQEGYGGQGRKYDVGQLDSLSFAFAQMENNKAHLAISDYSISQTTLEQVFLYFAKKQDDVVHLDETQWGESPQHLRCQMCGANTVTQVQYKPGSLTHISAIIACCCCCCCLPFCINSTKDIVHSCSNCQRVVGRKTRL